MTSLDEHASDFVMTARHGLDVCVRVQGQGAPLLLLNGFTRPLESWEPFVEALSDRMVIRFDAPGVGASPVPYLPLTILQLADVAVSVLDEVGVERADVLGFSHGGAVAQQIAVSHPERVRALVLVSTSCGLGTTPGTLDPSDSADLCPRFFHKRAKIRNYIRLFFVFLYFYCLFASLLLLTEDSVIN